MNTKSRAVSAVVYTLIVLGLACPGVASAQTNEPPPSSTDMSYLDNGAVRIGVDRNLGGAITYLADSEKRVNLVNSHDWGRQIQMSFYSGPRPFLPEGKRVSEPWKKLGWNPIQSGDCFGNRSRVLDHRNDGRTLYVKCVPMHWPLDNAPGQCTFESWIELNGVAVEVRCRLNNSRSDKTQYRARHQELPAVYTNGFLHRLMTYTGDRPFAGEALTRITKRWGPPDKTLPKGNPWDSWQATENWAALVGDDGWGLGIWTPDAQIYHGGFHGIPGSGGVKDTATGYIGPRHTEILDHNIQYEYSYVLILGSLDEIRQYVYAHAERPAPPEYLFDADRQHWSYVDCHDAGWPIRGVLHILPEGLNPQLIGPAEFWWASEAPKLRIVGAWRTTDSRARVFWRALGDRGFSVEKSLALDVIPDGKERVYELDLSSALLYRGVIAGLRFDPVETASPGDCVELRSISFR